MLSLTGHCQLHFAPVIEDVRCSLLSLKIDFITAELQFIKMKITEEKCGAIVALVNEGFSMRSVSKKLRLNFSTVQKVMARYRNTGSHGRQSGSGRRR